MIEKVEVYRTDDGRTFDHEEDAIHHEKYLDIERCFQNSDFSIHTKFDVLIEFLEEHKVLIIDYLTGEEQPDPAYQAKVAYRDTESIEAVYPIEHYGRVIRQPVDAWNTALMEVNSKLGLSGFSTAEILDGDHIKKTLLNMIKYDPGYTPVPCPIAPSAPYPVPPSSDNS